MMDKKKIWKKKKQKDKKKKKKPYFEKTQEQIQRINAALKGNFLFKALDEEQYKDLVDAMFEKTVLNGVDIIEQVVILNN